MIKAGAIAPNPGILSSSRRLVEFVSEMKSNYDCVIIDAPQISGSGEIMNIASLADACVLVVTIGVSDRDTLSSIFSSESNYKFENLGVVIRK